MWRSILAVAVLVFVVSAPAAAQKFVGSPSAKEMTYMDNEAKALRARLRDPKSAEFSRMYVSNKTGAPVVCGYVNSKNGFGGYSGAQRFIGASAAGISVMESDMAEGEMPGLWAKVC